MEWLERTVNRKKVDDNLSFVDWLSRKLCSSLSKYVVSVT